MDEIVCVCDGAVAGGWFMMLRGGDGAGGRMGGGGRCLRIVLLWGRFAPWLSGL